MECRADRETPDASCDSGLEDCHELRDGRMMCFREIVPEDAVRLQAFHERLSRETTRLRFFTAMPHLSGSMAEHLAEVDFGDRAAYVACFPGEDAIRAVGRYERESEFSAEAAFVVEDELQSLGIGGILLGMLAEHARGEKIERITAVTLAENLGMLTVFRNSGYPTDIHFEGSTAYVRIDIRGRGADRKEPRTLLPA
ncbi:MAG: GNAT family N-acetyltransferase [Tepidiformaceae bacterium]